MNIGKRLSRTVGLKHKGDKLNKDQLLTKCQKALRHLAKRHSNLKHRFKLMDGISDIEKDSQYDVDRAILLGQIHELSDVIQMLHKLDKNTGVEDDTGTIQ